MTDTEITITQRMHDPCDLCGDEVTEESFRRAVIKSTLSFAAVVLVWIVVLKITL